MWVHLDARGERGTRITSQGCKVQSEKADVLLKSRRSRESEDSGRFYRTASAAAAVVTCAHRQETRTHLTRDR